MNTKTPSRQTEEGFFAAAKQQSAYQQKMEESLKRNQVKNKIPSVENAEKGFYDQQQQDQGMSR